MSSLDGDWQFTLLPNPNAVTPANLQSAEWYTVAVPGLWTMQGFEKPHYLNIKMPFPNTPPSVPDANPVGVYHRYMTIPSNWQNRRVILHFGGVEGMLCVYVDGQAIGMGKDSRTPAEFDITRYVTAGQTHEVMAVVVRVVARAEEMVVAGSVAVPAEGSVAEAKVAAI